MHIHPEFHPHPAEDTLEEYAFNRLTEAETAAVEEHILVCSACQKDLQDIDEYILLMKAATAEYAVHPSEVKRGLAVKATWAVAAAVLVVLMFVPGVVKAISRWRADPVSAPAAVVLAAFRGGDGATMSPGPAGRPLELSIDAADLPGASGYRIEVVDATGQPNWSGAASLNNGTLSVQVTKALKPGTHWVRLFAAQGELLREFGLRLQ